MTFIAVHCPHCQSDQIVKRGKTARGIQRYITNGVSLLQTNNINGTTQPISIHF
jgi:hypothetical protein